MMIVEIFISEGESNDPLGQHGLLVMGDHFGESGVGNDLVESAGESDLKIDFAEEESAAIGGELPATEVRNDFLAMGSGKLQ